MNNKKGFTLIELLVVIAIIGLLSTIAVVALNNARMRSRDARRLADVRQIQTALELYQDDQGLYPAAATSGGAIMSGTTTYMSYVPFSPSPNDGGCSAGDNTYTYTAQSAQASYTITYCIGKTTAGITGGVVQTATPGGIK